MKGFYLLLALLVSVTACTNDGQNKVTSKVIKPIQVSIKGNVIYKETNSPIQGLTVGVEARNNEGTVVSEASPTATATTDKSGNFEFSEKVTLDTENYIYFLSIIDQRTDELKTQYEDSNSYATHNTKLIYSNKDADLEFSNINILLASNPYKTILQGVVKGIVDNGSGSKVWRPIPGATVNLKSLADGSVPYSVSTYSDGTFKIRDCIVQQYTITIDASSVSVDNDNNSSTAAVAKAFVVEDNKITLRIDDEQNVTTTDSDGNTVNTGEKYIQLSTFFLVEQLDFDDLRLVLQWDAAASSTDPAYDLDMEFSLPKPTVLINTLNGQQIKLDKSYYTVSPQSGFGSGSAYWPEFLGGERYDDNREVITEDNDASTQVNSISAVYHDSSSGDGSEPEIITFEKVMMIDSTIASSSPLAYYYDWQVNEAGDTIQHYPVGVGVLSVYNTSTDSTKQNIFQSGAKIKVYQGNSRIGTFDITELTFPISETNTKTWTPLMIEYGFKKSDLSTVDEDKDIYFRVVPFDSVDRLVSPELYVYHDVRAKNAYDGDSGTTTGGGIDTAYSGYVDADGIIYVGGDNGGTNGIWMLDWETVGSDEQKVWRWKSNSAPYLRSGTASDMYLAFTPADDDLFMSFGDDVTSAWGSGSVNCSGSTTITSLLYASNGSVNVIFTGSTVGLYAYDGSTCTTATSHIGTVTNSPAAVPTYSLLLHEFTGGKYVLAGTNSGIYSLDIETPGSWTNTPPDGGTVPAGQVNGMVSYFGNVYAGTENNGLYYYLADSTIGQIESTHTTDADWYRVSTSLFPQSGTAIKALIVFNERVFIGTSAGIYIHDPFGTVDSNISQYTDFPTGIQVNGFVRDGDTLYVLTQSNGIFIIR